MLNCLYIAFNSEVGGSYDANGNPVASTKSLSAYIPCNYKMVNRELKFLVEGQYIQAKYSIYINNADLPLAVNINSVKEAFLKDLNGNVIGKYFIHDMEPLSKFNITKLIVA